MSDNKFELLFIDIPTTVAKMSNTRVIDDTMESIEHGPVLNDLASSLMGSHFIDIDDGDTSTPSPKSLICQAVFKDMMIRVKWSQEYYDQFDEIKFPCGLGSITKYSIDKQVHIYPTYLFAFLECVRMHYEFDNLLQVHKDGIDYIYGVNGD